jgi:hypothetical protein
MDTLPAGVRPANPVRRLSAAIEPWYDWGTINVERMQGLTRERSNGEGDVGFVELQFLGLHVGLQLGRTPAARRG